jgi:hypothetical protein
MARPVMCERCGSRVAARLVKNGECRGCRERSDGFDPRRALLENAG